MRRALLTWIAAPLGLLWEITAASATPVHDASHDAAAAIQAAHAPADVYSAMLGFMPHVPVGLVLCGALALALTPWRTRDVRGASDAPLL